MTMLTWGGVGMLILGILNILDVARRKGEAFEYASAMLTGEIGLFFLTTSLIPDGTALLIIIVLFAISIVSTMIVFFKLLGRYNQAQKELGNLNAH